MTAPIEHWMTTGLLGANASFQRAAREYAEEYAALAVAAERERWDGLARQTLEVMENYRSEHAQSRITGLVYTLRERLDKLKSL